jgi:hypothetical protein
MANSEKEKAWIGNCFCKELIISFVFRAGWGRHFSIGYSFQFGKKSKEWNLGMFSVIDAEITYLSEEGRNRLYSNL